MQEGTPTPNTPVEIQSVGDKTKNLFDKNNIEIDKGLATSTGGLYNSTSYFTTDYIPIEKNQDYTLNWNTTRWYCFYDENKNYISYSQNRTFTNVDASYVRITVDKTELDTFQLEVGTTATEYEPYGYKISVKVSGKNFINKDKAEENYFINSSGKKTSTESYGLKVTDKIYVNPSTQYTYSGMGNVSGTTVMRCGYQYDVNDNPIKTISYSSGKAITFTTEANCSYVLLQYVKTEETPMLEKGSTTTEYEAYQEPTTTNIYLDEPLRKVGDYADYIDFENQKVVRNIYRDKLSNISFAGKSGISTSNNFYVSILYSSNELNLKPNILISDESTWQFTPNILSETLPSISWETMRENNDIYGICITEDEGKTANEIRVAVPTSVATTLNDFKTWLSNNDSDIYYVMLNPEEETIDLPDIIIKDTSTVIVETQVQPSKIEK